MGQLLAMDHEIPSVRVNGDNFLHQPSAEAIPPVRFLAFLFDLLEFFDAELILTKAYEFLSCVVEAIEAYDLDNKNLGPYFG